MIRIFEFVLIFLTWTKKFYKIVITVFIHQGNHRFGLICWMVRAQVSKDIKPMHLVWKVPKLETGSTQYCSTSWSDPLWRSLSRVMSSNTNHHNWNIFKVQKAQPKKSIVLCIDLDLKRFCTSELFLKKCRHTAILLIISISAVVISIAFKSLIDATAIWASEFVWLANFNWILSYETN